LVEPVRNSIIDHVGLSRKRKPSISLIFGGAFVVDVVVKNYQQRGGIAQPADVL